VNYCNDWNTANAQMWGKYERLIVMAAVRPVTSGGTYEIAGRLVVVEQSLHCESLRADTVCSRAD
jgi:hypothetical protein